MLKKSSSSYSNKVTISTLYVYMLCVNSLQVRLFTYTCWLYESIFCVHIITFSQTQDLKKSNQVKDDNAKLKPSCNALGNVD